MRTEATVSQNERAICTPDYFDWKLEIITAGCYVVSCRMVVVVLFVYAVRLNSSFSDRLRTTATMTAAQRRRATGFIEEWSSNSSLTEEKAVRHTLSRDMGFYTLMKTRLTYYMGCVVIQFSREYARVQLRNIINTRERCVNITYTQVMFCS